MQPLIDEQQRIMALLEAQQKAAHLFTEIQARELIRPGIKESDLNEAIYNLAKELYGISTYWHKRIVRAGKNTLLPYNENPPDLTLAEDEILFLDFGPVFEDWEADFGRTYVLGSDPHKIKICADVEKAFEEGKQYFNEHPALLSHQLFQYAVDLAHKYGWEFGGPIAGHLIGHFPHERIPEDKISLFVHPKSQLKMRSLDQNGQNRHWILEIHFIDPQREIGAFYEQLLTV